MCGRFTLISSPEVVAQVFQVQDVEIEEARYNIAPSQPVATVLRHQDSDKRSFEYLQWGLIPAWSKDKKIGYKLINARAETVADKPSFCSAFKQRRCLVVADGFYEWQEQDGKKQPFYIQMKDKHPFAFSGLWEHWQNEAGEEIRSCTIITTEANEKMRSLHPRMPVILPEKDYDVWLNPKETNRERLESLLKPFESDAMEVYPVKSVVNNPRNETPDCIKGINEL